MKENNKKKHGVLLRKTCFFGLFFFSKLNACWARTTLLPRRFTAGLSRRHVPPLSSGSRRVYRNNTKPNVHFISVSALFLDTGNHDAPSSSGLILVPLVQHEHVVLGDPGPALAVDVIEVDLPAAVGVAVRGLVNGAAAQLARLLHGQVVPQAAVHHAVGVHGPRAHGEQVATHPVPLRVDVVEPCGGERRKRGGLCWTGVGKYPTSTFWEKHTRRCDGVSSGDGGNEQLLPLWQIRTAASS